MAASGRSGARLVAGGVPQRQARGDGETIGENGEAAGIAGGPRRGAEEIVATIPATMSGTASRSDSARQATPTAISPAGRDGRLASGPRPGRSRREGERDRDAATVRPGHQAATVAPTTASTTRKCDQPPRETERVDPMIDRRFEHRGKDDPEREPRDRSDDRGERRPRRRWRPVRGGGASPWRRRRRASRAGGPTLSDDMQHLRRQPARRGGRTRWRRRRSPRSRPHR